MVGITTETAIRIISRFKIAKFSDRNGQEAGHPQSAAVTTDRDPSHLIPNPLPKKAIDSLLKT